MEVNASGRVSREPEYEPEPEPEPKLGRYRYFWPPDSSSSKRHQILNDDIVGSGGRSNSQSQCSRRESYNFMGGGVRQSVDEVELFDDEEDDWIDVRSNRQMSSRSIPRSTSSGGGSHGGRTLQLTTRKRQKQATIQGFMR